MKKKEALTVGGLVLLLLIAFTALSYGAFTYSRTGEKVNQISTGMVGMDYKETDNIIQITNALPTTDVTGKAQMAEGQYFDFSIKTQVTGNSTIHFEIAAEDLDGSTFSGANVKYYLTKINADNTETQVMAPKVYEESQTANQTTGRPAGQMSLLSGTTNTKGEEVTNYRLRIYVSDTYNPQGDGGGLIYKTRVNVYGKAITD